MSGNFVICRRLNRLKACVSSQLIFFAEFLESRIRPNRVPLRIETERRTLLIRRNGERAFDQWYGANRRGSSTRIKLHHFADFMVIDQSADCCAEVANAIKC